jgi:hypothetical protein
MEEDYGDVMGFLNNLPANGVKANIPARIINPQNASIRERHILVFPAPKLMI